MSHESSERKLVPIPKQMAKASFRRVVEECKREVRHHFGGGDKASDALPVDQQQSVASGSGSDDGCGVVAQNDTFHGLAAAELIFETGLSKHQHDGEQRHGIRECGLPVECGSCFRKEPSRANGNEQPGQGKREEHPALAGQRKKMKPESSGPTMQPRTFIA